jgi:hypothetical protein
VPDGDAVEAWKGRFARDAEEFPALRLKSKPRRESLGCDLVLEDEAWSRA